MQPSRPDQTGAETLSHEEIRSQLERIIASPEFPKTGRSGAMLTYVIEETLAGRANRIKAYSIAITIFNRPERPAIDDPVVRIEAARLRRHLERHYLLTGRDDPIRIDIPKGGYVPTFTLTAKPVEHVEEEFFQPAGKARFPYLEWPSVRRQILAAWAIALACAAIGMALWVWNGYRSAPQIAERTLPDAPTVVVAPFAASDNAPDAKLYAMGITEELLTALPRFKELRVFGRETSVALPPEPDVKNVRSQLGARYLVTGAVRIDTNQIRVTARLLDTASNTIIWTEDYDGQLKTQGLFPIESRIANSVATTIAQPNGIISRADAASLRPDDLNVYACTLRFYEYRAELSADKHLAVRNCLESAVARYPQYATAWAMLSIVYLDEHRFKYNPTAGAPALERSLWAARRAMELDPSNARAGQALMTSLFFNGYLEQSLQAGEQALEANPNDTELMGEYGVRLAMSGQWAKGASTLQAALNQNPGAGGFYNGVLALAKYMQQDYQGADDQIRKANLQKFPLFHIVAAVIFAENGMTEDAARERVTVTQTDPGFLRNLTADLKMRLGRPEDRARLLEGLRKAGLVTGESAVSAQQ